MPQGARIAVYANNVPEWVLLEFGCGLAGLTLVTVNPAYQKRELKYVLEQSRSEALYYVEDFRGSPMKAIADDGLRRNSGDPPPHPADRSRCAVRRRGSRRRRTLARPTIPRKSSTRRAPPDFPRARCSTTMAWCAKGTRRHGPRRR